MQPEYMRLREVAGALARGDDPRPVLRGLRCEAFVRLANAHKISGLLYEKLAMPLDPEMSLVRAQLRRTAIGIALRNERLRDQIGSLVTTLNGAGITPTLLKGAARIWTAQPGWRAHPSIDLDILVDPDQIERAREALICAGYRDGVPHALASFYRTHHHAAPLIREGGVPVEIHRALGPPQFFSIDLTQRGLASHLVSAPVRGMRANILDIQAAALHLAVHGVPYAALRDLYLLAAALGSMSMPQRAALRAQADAERKERVRLAAVLYQAAALARVPWPAQDCVVRCAQWSVQREQIPAWQQSRSQCADAALSCASGAPARFIAHALPPPAGQPMPRLVLLHPLRVASRLAVGAALLARYGMWEHIRRTSRQHLRDLVRSNEAFYRLVSAARWRYGPWRTQALPPQTAIALERYPELRTFVRDIRRAARLRWSARARRHAFANALTTLVRSPFLLAYVNGELERVAKGESLGRLNEYEQRLTLLQLPEYVLSVSFINVRRASREIASTACNACFAPLHGDVRLARYRVPQELRRGLFSRSAKLEALGEMNLSARQATELTRASQAYALRSDHPDIVGIMFEERAREALVWRFDPDSLSCVGVTPSDVKITRLKETLRFIESMNIRDAAPYVRSLATHTSHFLRWAAISTLYRLDRPAAMPLLRRAKRDPHPHVRRAAAVLLNERPSDGVNA